MPRRKRPLPPWLMGVDDDNCQEDTELDNNPKAREQDNNKTESNMKLPAKAAPLSTEMKKTKPSAPEILQKQTDTAPCLTAVDIVEMSYPEYSFKGTIVYSYNKDDCNILCEEFLSEISSTQETVIGFDMEWPVTYEKGKQGKTALIQIAPTVDKCYLFHLSCMPKFPVILKKLIQMENVKKVGLNIGSDFWKLEADYDIVAKDIIQKSAIELKTLANQKLKAAENWSLEGLTKNMLRQRLSKDPAIRKCDWSQFPLTEKQQRYAASDAVMSLMLWHRLSSMGVATSR